MADYPASLAAARAGIDPADFERFAAHGLLAGTSDRVFGDGDVRRAQVIAALEHAGLPAEHLAQVVRAGELTLEFMDEAGASVFAPVADLTFAEVAEETGIPVEQLLVVREVTGGRTALAGDRLREDELAIVPLVRLQVALGFRWPSIERALRVYGDSLRRIAEAEAEWWRSEVQAPALAGDRPAGDLAEQASDISPRMSERSDRAVMAIYHAQQRHVWTTNIVAGIAAALEEAGLHRREERLPAMAFLDLAGYTELTAQQGDAAAVAVVERVSRIVGRVAVEHGGRPVKWLGDGVMLHFPNASAAVRAVLGMVAILADAGLPPAHVGVHAGPIIVQEGDYYGQTVNLASRIGDRASAGEVLVTAVVVDDAAADDLVFDPIGEAALKGVAGPVRLFRSPVARLTDQPEP